MGNGCVERGAIGADRTSQQVEALAATVSEWIDEQRDLILIGAAMRISKRYSVIGFRSGRSFASRAAK